MGNTRCGDYIYIYIYTRLFIYKSEKLDHDNLSTKSKFKNKKVIEFPIHLCSSLVVPSKIRVLILKRPGFRNKPPNIPEPPRVDVDQTFKRRLCVMVRPFKPLFLASGPSAYNPEMPLVSSSISLIFSSSIDDVVHDGITCTRGVEPIIPFL
ncbi:hypothetical protein CIPAW_09G009400 [Carya illinoinensis]|uniref:Uncharacterized protein n=1 Tax=Carya illinoinensis TaxID=32201 RepID=A0A8T1PEN8_CARIL|nr:hypothetical protein CIPAW_09G009400 [Carya illinoinensis]